MTTKLRCTKWILLFMALLFFCQSMMAQKPLSPGARELIRTAFEGIDPGTPIVDIHAHLVGVGRGSSGCEVNSRMLSWRHPMHRVAANLYLSASGVQGFEHFDRDYVDRLVGLVNAFGHPVKLYILALDRNHNRDGTPNPEKTEFYVPNEWIVKVAAQHLDLFVPVISVHPARKDAIPELEKWAAQGVRYLKWLPNAQNIDPADPSYEAFYRRMKELDVVLLTHTGEEKAVAAKGAQSLGNPLKLRRALDAGVTVIMAHCASLGQNEDLDHPGRKAPNFDLFLRLMGEERYRGRLFGDISAMTQFNRLPGPLSELLRRPDLQERLVNGSDYPLPAMNCVIWTRRLVRLGMITCKERKALNEIYQANPLLFDFVLKRTIKNRKTGQRLAKRIFLEVPSVEKSHPGI